MPAERFEVPRWGCLDLLQTTPVGRICFLAERHPIALPINFRFVTEGDSARAVLRTGVDSMLGRYQGPASLEVDHIALDTGRAWSVIVRGELRPAFDRKGLDDPKPFIAGRDRWMVLDVGAISGRRFVVSLAPDGYSVDWQID